MQSWRLSMKEIRTVYGWTVESTRQRAESLQSKNHGDRMAGKRIHFCDTFLLWCTSLSQCHKRWRFRMLRPPWIKNGKSSRKSQHGMWEKSRAKRRLFWKHKETIRKSTLLHWWTHSTSKKMRSQNPNCRNTKAESCSEETLWRTILEPTQFLLNRARLRPTSLLQKSWTLLQDFQVVMEKPPTQYQLISK